jgi:hypothetical protein
MEAASSAAPSQPLTNACKAKAQKKITSCNITSRECSENPCKGVIKLERVIGAHLLSRGSDINEVLPVDGWELQEEREESFQD